MTLNFASNTENANKQQSAEKRKTLIRECDTVPLRNCVLYNTWVTIAREGREANRKTKTKN